MNKNNLERLFRNRFVMNMKTMQSLCKPRSKRSLFRDLCSIGYLSSYSHAGQFYTLTDIPNFNNDGLWYYENILFSKYGTLKATICKIIENSLEGFTHHDLKVLLQVRVQNTLNELVNKNVISRQRIGNTFLYISKNKKTASLQIVRRKDQLTITTGYQSADTFTTIEVLLELIRTNDWNLKNISGRLRAKGISVTIRLVEEILTRYNLKKNSKFD